MKYKFNMGDIVTFIDECNEKTIFRVVGLKIDSIRDGIEYLCVSLAGYGSSYYNEKWLVKYEKDITFFLKQQELIA